MAFCAICTNQIEGEPKREPLGAGGALVNVCDDCSAGELRLGTWTFGGGARGTAHGRYEVGCYGPGKMRKRQRWQVSAHHVKHAITCPAYGNGELTRCTCGAPGSAKAKQRSLAMTPAETVAEIDELGANRNAIVARTNARIAESRRTGSGYPGGGIEGVKSGVRIERIGAPTPEPPPPISVLGVPFSPPEEEDDDGMDLDALADEGLDAHHAAERELYRIGREVGRLLQRTIEVTRRGPGPTLTIAQRCSGCGGDILHAIPGEGDTLALVAAVGIKARVAYAGHKCAPVENSLHGFTWDELRELEQSLEAESLRIAQRVVDIQRLAKERR